MERITWTARIKPGMKAEYIKRHDEIWPEMSATLHEAGVTNYSIWCVGEDTLFGYYEATRGAKAALDFQANSPVVAKWNVYMLDVMEMVKDPVTGQPMVLEEVFRHD